MRHPAQPPTPRATGGLVAVVAKEGWGGKDEEGMRRNRDAPILCCAFTLLVPPAPCPQDPQSAGPPSRACWFWAFCRPRVAARGRMQLLGSEHVGGLTEGHKGHHLLCRDGVRSAREEDGNHQLPQPWLRLPPLLPRRPFACPRGRGKTPCLLLLRPTEGLASFPRGDDERHGPFGQRFRHRTG
jgi:hypothetical protein